MLAEKAGNPVFAKHSVAGLCMFSKTGFDAELLEAVPARRKVYLFNENHLVDCHA